MKVLWSNEITFLVGGRTVKQKVTRKRGERIYLIYIQYQFHHGNTILVNAWGVIRYGYKSPLLFIRDSGKKGAFKQIDYLS